MLQALENLAVFTPDVPEVYTDANIKEACANGNIK